MKSMPSPGEVARGKVRHRCAVYLVDRAPAPSSSGDAVEPDMDVVRFLRSVSLRFVTPRMITSFASAGFVDGNSLRAAARLDVEEQRKMFRDDMGLSERDVSLVVVALRKLL